MKKGFFLSLIGIVFLFSSCIKSDDLEFDKIASTNWNPDVSLPLVYSSITIKDIIGLGDTSIFVVDPNRLVSLVYNTDLISTSSINLVPIPSASYIELFSLNNQDSIDIVNNGSVTKNVSRTVPFPFPAPQQIDSIVLREGIIHINITNSIPRPGTALITLPFALRNGMPFSTNVNFLATNGYTVDTIVDLSNYTLALSGNAIGADYSVTFNSFNSPNRVTQRGLSISLDLDSLIPSAIFGFFGQLAIDIPVDTSEISIFKNSLGGTFFLDDPKFELNVKNSFGIPVSLITNSVLALDNSSIYPFTGYPNPFDIGYPSVPGQSVASYFVCDRNNSNVQAVMAQTPGNIIYDLSAITNPTGTGLNFILDSSRVDASINISFPLRGYASAFVIQDTVDFNLDRISELQSATFRVTTINEFPAEAYTQVYFTDSTYNFLDSMLLNPSDLIIEGALTAPSGQVLSPKTKTTDQLFSLARLENIFNAKKLLIKSIVSTTNAPNNIVSIYDYYRLQVKIGVNAKLKINVN